LAVGEASPRKDIALMVTVIVEVPDGVTTGGVARGVGATERHFPSRNRAWITEQRKISAGAPLHAKRPARNARSNIHRFIIAFSKTERAPEAGAREFQPQERSVSESSAAARPLPLVVTVTCNDAGTPFAIDTLAGTWHVAPRGAPLHVSDTLRCSPAQASIAIDIARVVRR